MQSQQVYLPLYLNSDLARDVLLRSRIESRSIDSIVKEILATYFEDHPASLTGKNNIKLNNTNAVDLDLRRKVGLRIAYLRKTNYLSQKALGELFGLAQKTISKIELGDRKVDISELVAFSQFFEVSLSYFFE